MTENITCRRCRHRHPAARSCEEAKRLADEGAAVRRASAVRIAEFAVSEAEADLVEAFARQLGSGSEECYGIAREMVAKISALIVVKANPETKSV